MALALARVTNDVLSVGWQNDGVTDNAAFAASLGNVSNVIGTEGDYRLDSAVEIAKPLHVRAGAKLIIGATADVLINAPFTADTLLGDASIVVEDGGVLRFGAKSHVELRASWFGAHPGMGEASATDTTIAFNTFFQVYRASNPTASIASRIGGLYIDRGEYWIDNFIWAGFDAGSVIRHYTLFAHDVTIWITEHAGAGWGTSPVWDMTGAGIDNATIYGLRLRTKAGMDMGYFPYVGLLMSRFVNGAGKAVTSARTRLHDVTVSGDFDLCAHLNFASEQARYHNCDFENHHEQGQWAMINQETPYYVVTSEFADLPTAKISNGGLEFYGTHFDYAWRGDPELGGGVHLIGAKSPKLYGGWINPGDVNATRGAAIRFTQDVPNSGTQPHQLTLRDVLFHRSHEYCVQLDGIMSDITLDCIKASPRRALVRVTAGSTIKGIHVEQRFGSIRTPQGLVFTVDPATDTFTIEDLPFAEDDAVKFTGGVAPGGFVLGTTYYVGDVTFDVDTGLGTMRLYDAVGGALVDATDAVDSSTLGAGYTTWGVDASAANADLTNVDITLGLPCTFNRYVEGTIRQPAAAQLANVFSGSASQVKVALSTYEGTTGSVDYRNVKVLASGSTGVIGAEQAIRGWKSKNLPADMTFYAADFGTADDPDEIIADRDGHIVGWTARSSTALTAGSIRVIPQIAPISGGVDAAFASIATSRDLSAAGDAKQYVFTLTTPVAFSKGDRLRFLVRGSGNMLPTPMPMVATTLIIRPR